MAAASPSAAEAPNAASAYVRGALGISSYKQAIVDLNGDDHAEIFVYATGSDWCGSGGCTLFVLSPQAKSFKVVLRSTVTQLPIRLLDTVSHGWKDIAVTVGGGGITHGYTAKLRFNGRRYPSNPTVPPAIPMKTVSGRVLIGK